MMLIRNISPRLRSVVTPNTLLRQLSAPILMVLASMGARKAPVFVYQMGKVGSYSIHRSLQQHGKYPVIHGHFLDSTNVHLFRPGFIDETQQPFVYDTLRAHAALAHFLKSMLRGHRQIKVISLVRDPVARNLSLFFQHFALYTGVRPAAARFNVAELTDIFLHRFRHAMPLDWFDIEMKPNLSIDVYATPFPKDIGYTTIRQNRVSVLLLKLETDMALRQQAIADFLLLQNFQLGRWNEAQSKPYADLYKSFIQHIRLPTSYLDAMYYSKYVRHFYRPDEIDTFYTKWQRP